MTLPSTRRSRIWARLRAELEFNECLLILGVVLMTAALWPSIHVLALIVPGSVLLWLALPPRKPFVDGSPDPSPRRKA